MGREAEYDASQLQVLEGWEAIRKRPGMYVGSTGERGLHILVFEVVDRAVNEVLAGRASRVDVTLMPDGGVRVADDGPGFPFEDTDVPGLEYELTRMYVRVGLGAPRYPMFGFCGVGLLVVNALSSRLVAEVQREGVRQAQEYMRATAVTRTTDASPAVRTGTTITFWPDAEIFQTTQCSFDTLAERLRELAFLNRQLDISLTDERRVREPRSLRFQYPRGTRDMVAFLDEQAAVPVHSDVIGFAQEDARMSGTVEVALRWRDRGEPELRSFANCRPTPEGGAHVAGFCEGVAAAVNTHARQRGPLTAADPDFSIDQISKGLTAVISVKLEYPDFEGSTRGRLGNPAVRAYVRQAVHEHLGSWFEEHPHQAATVIDRITQEARADRLLP